MYLYNYHIFQKNKRSLGHPHRWIILNKYDWTFERMMNVSNEIDAYPDSNLIVATESNKTYFILNQCINSLKQYIFALFLKHFFLFKSL